MVTINQLVDFVAEIAAKRIGERHIPGPLGVRGRNCDNRFIKKTGLGAVSAAAGQSRADLSLDQAPACGTRLE
jgi:hypothetical protein